MECEMTKCFVNTYNKNIRNRTWSHSRYYPRIK